MKKIKIFSFTLALLLAVFAFSSCSKFEYDNSTIVAQVTAIDGQKVTLLVGEMDMGGNMMQGGMMPGGNMQGGNMIPSTGDGSIPAIPEGEVGEMPALPEGDTMPDGEVPQLPEGETMPQMPENGSMPEMPNGEVPEMPNGMQSPFTAGDDSITLTLNEETVKTLTVGSIVQITFGDNGSVESLMVIGGNMQGDFGGGNMTPPTNLPEIGTNDEETTGDASDDANS